jgi:CheY-like chemotaxis protein
LGLHITKSLLEQHGGTIEMFSEGIDRGCLTIIELPLYRNAAAAAAARKAKSLLPPDSIEMEPPTLVPVTAVELVHSCLIVDDALSNRKMLVRLLERSGHICKSANNGQEAVDIIEADLQESLANVSHVPIDTILMDYEMPVLNGPDATKIIRAIGYSALIIGVTGNVLVEDVAYFISMGANRVLPKPVNIAAIKECWETLDDGGQGTINFGV